MYYIKNISTKTGDCMKFLLIFPLLLIMVSCASPQNDNLARQYVTAASANMPYVMDSFRATGVNLDGKNITFRYEYRGAEMTTAELLDSLNKPHVGEENFKQELASICSRRGAFDLLSNGYTIYMLFLTEGEQLNLPVDYNACRQAAS